MIKSNNKSLLNSFSSKRDIKLVHVDDELHNVKTKIDLILSPSYYWHKVEELELKSLTKAKKLSESIFNSVLPIGDFKYKVIKKDSFFLFFAYDSAYILDSLIRQGLKKDYIGRVYFAQNEIDCKKPIELSQKSVLVERDGVVVVMPKHLVNGATAFDVTKVALKSFSVDLSGGVSGDIPPKVFMLILFFTLLWIIAEGVQSYKLSSELELGESKKSQIYVDANLPSTSFQVDSIKKRLIKIQKTQDSIREIVSKFTTNYTDLLISQEFTYKKQEFVGKFVIRDGKTLDDIVKKLESDFKKAVVEKGDKEISIRIKI